MLDRPRLVNAVTMMCLMLLWVLSFVRKVITKSRLVRHMANPTHGIPTDVCLAFHRLFRSEFSRLISTSGLTNHHPSCLFFVLIPIRTDVQTAQGTSNPDPNVCLRVIRQHCSSLHSSRRDSVLDDDDLLRFRSCSVCVFANDRVGREWVGLVDGQTERRNEASGSQTSHRVIIITKSNQEGQNANQRDKTDTTKSRRHTKQFHGKLKATTTTATTTTDSHAPNQHINQHTMVHPKQ